MNEPDEKAPSLSPALAALDPDAAPPGGGPGVTDQGAPGAAQSPGPDPARARDAAMVARLGVDFLADSIIKQYPMLAYSDEARARCAELAGAVMAKHDLFGWLARWREEFELGAFVAGIAWQSYRIVQQSKAPPPAAAPAAASAADAG
jgi:hypothetical protein